VKIYNSSGIKNIKSNLPDLVITQPDVERLAKQKSIKKI